MLRRKLAIAALTAIVLGPLSGCQSHTGQFLMKLSWSLTKDAVTALPFAGTAAFLVESITTALKKGETIGLAGLLPALDGDDVSLGVLTRFLPDYLRKVLEEAGLNFELLEGRDGGSPFVLGADGTIELSGDSLGLAGVDYVLSGVAGSRGDGLGIEIKLAPTQGQGETLFFGSSARYDADTLALMGANQVIEPPLPVYARCGQRPEMRTLGTADGVEPCKFLARADGADNFLCVSCGGASRGRVWMDPQHQPWKSVGSEPFQMCMKVQPHAGAGTYQGEAEGPIAGSETVSGVAASVLEPGTIYTTTVRRGEEYDVGLQVSPLTHTGTSVPRRLAMFLSVDGVNSIGQKLEIPTEGDRWALRPGATTVIPGWQMNDDEARRFKFVSFEDSVAVRLGAEQNVGQITAIVYAEKDRGCPEGPLCNVAAVCPPTVVATPSLSEDEGPGGGGKYGGGGMKSSAAPSARPRKKDAGRLGTGEGEQIRREVEHVDLELEDEPIAVMTLHYRGESTDASDTKRVRIIAPPITY